MGDDKGRAGGARKRPAKAFGLAALQAMRDRLPIGPDVRYWLLAKLDLGTECGWVAVTRYRRTIGYQSDADLRLPDVSFRASVMEENDGRLLMEISGFLLTLHDKDGGWHEEPTHGVSVYVDGQPATRVGATFEVNTNTEISVRGSRTSYKLRIVDRQPTSSAEIAMKEYRRTVDVRDVMLLNRRRQIEGDLRGAGWVYITEGGALECTGVVECLALVIDQGGSLQCSELVTNYLSASNLGRGVTVNVGKIRTRVARHVDRALDEVIGRGALEADYCQHEAGDLNPSWSHASGTLLLLPELYVKGEDDGEPVEILEDEIRARLRTDADVFTSGGRLVR